MPLPSIITSLDSFNTWIDATNNVISHIANTSTYIIVQQSGSPTASVGNVALNGSATVWTFGVLGNTTGNLVFTVNGTAMLVNTTMSVTNVATFLNTVAITGATTIAGALTVNSTLSVTNATFSVVNGTATHFSTNSTHTNVAGTLSVVGLASLLNAAAITGNVTASNASAVVLFINSSSLNINTTTTAINGTAVFSSTGSLNARGPFVSNALMELGGPIHLNSGFITNIELGGEGVVAKMAVAINTGFLRINTITSVVKTVAGIECLNTTAYRLLTVFNDATNDLTFLHESASATLAVERIKTPDGLSFVLVPGAGAAFFYDANTSVQRWRVLQSSSAVEANTTIAGIISTGTQSFDGAKTFTGAKVVISNSTGFVLPVGTDKYAT